MGRSSLPSRIAFAQLMLIALLLAAACPPASAQQPQPETSGNQRYPAYQDDLPATPLSHLKAPLPPRQAGCFHLDQNRRWEGIPCASNEYLREHPVPPPFTTNSIQSTPHAIGLFPRYGSGIFTAPFVLGSVAVNITSDPPFGQRKPTGRPMHSAFRITLTTFHVHHAQEEAPSLR